MNAARDTESFNGAGAVEGAERMLVDYDSTEERAARRQIRAIMAAQSTDAEWTYRGAHMVFRIDDREVSAVEYLNALKASATGGGMERRAKETEGAG